MRSKSLRIPTRILSVDGAPGRFLKELPPDEILQRKTPMGWHSTRALLTTDQIEELSRLGSVFHLDRQPEFILHGERANQSVAGNLIPSGSAPFGPGYPEWLLANGLTGGEGMMVQVQDDGLDQGIATNQPGTVHPDLLGRVAGILNVTSDPLGDSRDGHGQINAGILIGNAATGMKDSAGYLLGQGMVPKARVYATKIFQNGGRFDIGRRTLPDLAIPAQNEGATFSSNSWGAVVAGLYLEESAEFDYLTRDADPIEPGNQPMVYFFSAGNEGPEVQSIGSPGSAKNVITVGAGENTDGDGTDGCGVSPLGADDIRDVIGFSSRGPLADGRMGPTLYTVGTHVQGPASTHADYNGSGVCDRYWPPDQTLYSRSSGTSHSTPVACGAGMLVAEFFNRVLSNLEETSHRPNPSPALIKAVLANTATDNSGNEDGRGGALGAIPNSDQGWGALNLNRFFSMKEKLYSRDQVDLFTDSGQSWETPITVLDPNLPLKITLAWSDAPGAPNAGKALVNDLDLSLFGQEGSFFGNRFESGFSTLGGERDRL
ncbi:MAG: S8 family serine peptidase, partial [Candidatus Omnitrophica bacterium]|nr:S8 family serine peptidase [Candidatus Omnitrophota bacterium]